MCAATARIDLAALRGARKRPRACARGEDEKGEGKCSIATLSFHLLNPHPLGYAIERPFAYRVIIPQSVYLTAPPSSPKGSAVHIVSYSKPNICGLIKLLSRTAKRLRALHTKLVRTSRVLSSATAPNSNTLWYESNSTEKYNAAAGCRPPRIIHASERTKTILAKEKTNVIHTINLIKTSDFYSQFHI